MSKIKCFAFAMVLCLFLSFAQSKNIFAGDQDLTAEKVIAEHVKSIGSPSLLAGVKSRAFVGTTSLDFIQGGTGSLSGKSMLVSAGQKLSIVNRFSDVNYPQDYFAYDGKDVSVGYISPGQRSPLADFIFRYNGLFKAGLMGGTLSGNWPFLDSSKKADMKLKETTVDGQRLYEIEYQPKPALRDLKVRMYFDPKTFHHVRTKYEVRIKEGDQSVRQQPTDPSTGTRPSDVTVTDMKGNAYPGIPTSSASGDAFQVMPESIYVLVEKFDDFKDESGLVFPHSYTIDYSVEGQGHSFVAKWNTKFMQADFNKTYNDLIFKAQK